ncbi:24787_t:CDS:2 [Gigaspora margarita]|uniref:24787_t:CDS:1 n=1 Tax=Gigaspora margarita TaxID=4874 RepID=A0ABM8VYR1_GIGMA|nr:24787_t:CDS:2 [Gigaspora margarita]
MSCTSITLGVVSGIILPICIALIFYYRRHAKQAYQNQNPAAMTTQSEQISTQNFANGANKNMLNNQWNPNSGTSA